MELRSFIDFDVPIILEVIFVLAFIFFEQIFLVCSLSAIATISLSIQVFKELFYGFADVSSFGWVKVSG